MSPVGCPRPTLIALVAACVGSACGDGAWNRGVFSETPLLRVVSASGALLVDVYSAPQPPVRGAVDFRYFVTDVDGGVVEGLSFAVVPWMPSMGHGSSVRPSAEPIDAGLYELPNVSLFMPGQWELRTTISGSADDHVTPSFMVR